MACSGWKDERVKEGITVKWSKSPLKGQKERYRRMMMVMAGIEREWCPGMASVDVADDGRCLFVSGRNFH